MNDSLEIIANLEFGKASERISAETQEKLQSATARMPRGGIMEATRLQILLDQAEKTCKVYAQIWQDLLEAKNGGHLTRENVNFIARKVQDVAAARRGSLISGPDPQRLASAGGEIAGRMESIVASICRDLEIRIRRQEALPKREASEAMSIKVNKVTIQNAANVNLGTQAGTVYAALNAISGQSEEHDKIAAALKEISKALLRNTEIGDPQKQEALQVITEIAKQAEANPEARSIGTLRAMIEGFPTVLGVAADLTVLWDQYAPVIRHFFGI